MANQVIVTNTGNVQVALTPTPNVQVQISRAAITAVTDVDHANTANTVTNNAQPNITSVGTLTSLTSTGNITAPFFIGNVVGNISGNLVVPGANTAVLFNQLGNAGASDALKFDYSANVLTANGNIVANYFIGNGSQLTGIIANNANFANFANFAGNANIANSATVAASANSVAVANVVGIGNIATINLDGNVSNVLAGDGTFVALPTVSANANYANFAGTAFNVSGSNVTGAVANATYADSANTANLATYATTANSVAGSNVSGQVANALVAGTVYTNAQPNITSVGTLTGLTVDGNANITGNLTGVNSVTFDTANAPATVGVAQLSWNDGQGTLDLGLKGGNVTATVAQQQYARVYNAEANTLSKGEIVYVYGAQGNLISVKRALADGDANSAGTLGMVAESITSGGEGFVQASGAIYKLNTNGLTAGGAIYLSPTTPGAYTQTKPVAPNHTVILGWVERVSTTVGSIYLKVDNGYELDELHNVLITSPVAGQALVYNSSNLWVNGNPNEANYAAVANSVAVANVTGIGNIATINLDGNVSNVLSGNGSFVALPTVSANANYANFAGQVVDATQSNITLLGTLTDLRMSNSNVHLGTNAAANSQGINTVSIGNGAAAGGANISHTFINYDYANNILELDSTSGIVDGMNIYGTGFDGSQVTFGVIDAGNVYADPPTTTPSGTLYFNSGQANNSIAIGANAAYERQGYESIAIGSNAGYTFQEFQSIAIGLSAGSNSQGAQSVAIGYQAGSNTQGQQAFAMGYLAGTTNQGSSTVAIGREAGSNTQGSASIAIGQSAGKTTQGTSAVAIGFAAGNISQSGNAIAIGQGAGNNTQGSNAVAIGRQAGFNNQGANSIAIGRFAGTTNQATNSIVINATGANLNQTTANTFTVKPVRQANTSNVMFYNNTTGEISYDVASNLTVANADHANIADVANSVAVANVVGIGNIATVNLDGSSSNVLYGNGQWATISIPSGTSISNGTSNVSIPVANGNVLISTAGNANIVDIWAQGTLNLKPPAQGPLNALRIDTYGRSGNQGAQRISSFRYRGNSTTPLSVQPGDNTMELLTVGSNGTAAQTNSVAIIRAQVDASYTANGANIPLGWQVVVNDTNGGINNQSKTHNFYANGNVVFANSVFAVDTFTAGGNITSNTGNIIASSGVFIGNGAGLTNLPAGNVTGNFTYLNVVDSANVTGTIQQLAPNTITITTNSLQNTAYNLTTSYGESSNIVDVAGRSTIRSRGNVSTPDTTVVGDIGFRERVYFYNGTTNALGVTTSATLSNLNSNSNAYTTGASYNISVGAPLGDQGNANAASGLNLLQFNQNGQLVILPGATSTAGTGLQMYSYGQNTNLAQAQGITMTKARGNRDANLSVQANDTVGRVVFQPHNGTGVVTNRLAIIRASVDSSYVANTANVPVGITMAVCDNTTTYNHQFYANGTYTAPGAVTIPSGNLTMGPSQTIEVNRINQTGAGAITVYGPTTFNQGLYSEGATFAGNSDVSITGSSNGTPKNFYIGDFTNGNLNMSINGNLNQSKGNIFLATSNIFIYNGGNSINMNAVSDPANGNYANVTFDYGQFNEGLSTGGNLNVNGTLSINDLSSGNLTVGSYSNPHSNTASLWADVGIKGNVQLSGYDFFSNTYSPLLMQFGYGNVSLQILDGNIQVSNANGNGGTISTVNFSANNNASIGNLQLSKFQETVYSIGTTSGTITPDFNNGSIQNMTLNGNITMNSLANVITGRSMTLVITQDGTGGHTLTSSMLFAGGSKTLSTGAGAKDIISVFYDGSTYFASLTKGYA